MANYKTICILIAFLFNIFISSICNSLTMPSLEKSNEPINIEADKIYYDKTKDLIYASGDVILTQNKQIIFADQIVYSRTTEEIYAEGNLALTRDDGSIFFGDQIKFDRIHENGIILNFKGRFGKQSVIASRYAELISSNLIELDNVVYSPCQICSTNFVPNTPLWQFKASSAILNKKDESIVYKDAKLEAFGYTILYIPYLITPSPGAKSKSGFLIPDLNWSKLFGTYFRVPYFVKIQPNMDATLGLGFYQKVGNVYDMEFRHKLDNGSYKLFSSLTHTEKFDSEGNAIPGKKDLRGHYDFKGNYNLVYPYIKGIFTLNSRRVLDPKKTYLKKYHFSDDDVLKTDGHFRNITDDHYISLRSLLFQDLRPNTSDKTTAKVLPQITYFYEKTFSNLGIKADILMDYINISRPQGMNYARMVNIWTLNKNFLTNFGLFWKNQISIRGDFYNSHFHPVKVNSIYSPIITAKNGTEARYHPELVSSLNIPLYKIVDQNFITLDPIVQTIISPNQSNLKNVDNEDSQSPEISPSNLFVANRYKGYDLLENGNRINYGMRSLIKTNYFHNLSIIAGQTYRFHKDSNFDIASGLSGHISDYILKVSLQSNNSLQITNSTRFDQKNFNINRNEFNIDYSQPNYSFSLFHIHMNKKLIKYLQDDSYKQEMLLTGAIKFYKQWWVKGFIKSKLGKRHIDQTTRMISDGLLFKNSNECLNLDFGIQRDYSRLKDLKPSTTFIFRITIPTF